MLSHGMYQRGTTLVELMIAGVIALIALSALLSVYGASARHSSLQLERAHINQHMHGLLHLVSRDLRRAGYRAFDPAKESAASNPFQNRQNHLRTGHYANEAANSCILFAYDLDKDGLVGIGKCGQKNCAPGSDSDNVEQLGFRLKQQQLQSRYGGKTFDCNTGNWQSISDPGTAISKLAFTLQVSCTGLDAGNTQCTGGKPSLEQRTLSIQISGQLKNKPHTRLELGRSLQIRNDRLLSGNPAP